MFASAQLFRKWRHLESLLAEFKTAGSLPNTLLFHNFGPHFQTLPLDKLQIDSSANSVSSTRNRSLLISSIQTQPLYKPSKLGSYATSQPSSVIGPRLLFNQSLFLFTHMSRTATLNHTFLSPPLTSCSRLCLLLVPCNLKFPTGSLHPTNQARMNPKTQNYFSFQPLPRNSAQAKSKYPSTQQKQTPSHAASIHTSSNNSGKKKTNKMNEKKDQPERKKKAKK